MAVQSVVEDTNVTANTLNLNRGPNKYALSEPPSRMKGEEKLAAPEGRIHICEKRDIRERHAR